MIRNLVKNLLRSMGYQLSRIPRTTADQDLYRSLFRSDSIANKRFYNIGPGAFHHPLWTNVDKPSEWYGGSQKDGQFISHDLMTLVPLPIEDGTAEIIYTSHTLEHVNDRAADFFFADAFRVLNTHGILRVTMPDAELFFRAYQANDRDLFRLGLANVGLREARRIGLDRPAREMSLQQLLLRVIATSVSVNSIDGSTERMSDQQVDDTFRALPFEQALECCISKCDLSIQERRPGDHLNWWNWNKLSMKLQRAGFTKVRRCGYGQSSSPVLRNTTLFDSTRPESSLYAEAIK